MEDPGEDTLTTHVGGAFLLSGLALKIGFLECVSWDLGKDKLY